MNTDHADNMFEEICSNLQCEQIVRDLGNERITDENSERIYVDPPQRISASKRTLHVSKTQNRFLDWGDKDRIKGGPVQLAELFLFGSVTPHRQYTKDGNAWRAVDWCCERIGLPVHEKWGKSPHELQAMAIQRQEQQQVWGCLTAVMEYYHQALLGQPDKLKEFQLLYGLTDETIKDQKIGFSQYEEWTDSNGIHHPRLWDWLKEQGFTVNDCLKTGIFRPDSNGAVWPTFSCRWTFSYLDHGKVRYAIARKTRWTSPKDERKYIKALTWSKEKHPYVSPDIDNSYLFNEEVLGSELFEIIVAEGITDAIMGKQLGFAVISPVTTRFKKGDLKRVIQKLKGIIVFLIPDNEISGAGYSGALDSAQALEASITAKIAILTLTETQEQAREELESKFGISADNTEKENAEIKNRLSDEDKAQVQKLEAAAKMDLNLFGQQEGAREKLRALMDAAETRLESIIKPRIGRLEAGDETLLNDREFLEAMKDAESRDKALHFKALKAAAKGMKTPLKNAIKDVDMQPKGNGFDKPLVECLEGIQRTPPDECKNHLVPFRYLTTQKGIFVEKGVRGDTILELVCPDIVVISNRLQDIGTGSQKLEIKYIQNDTTPSWHTLTGDRDLVFDSRRNLQFAKQGLTIGTPNARNLAEYLIKYESLNIKNLPIRRSSAQCGYHGDKAFLFGPLCFGDEQILFAPPCPSDANLNVKFTQAGDFDVWLKLAEEVLTEYPLVAAQFYGAFTAPLLRILRLQNFFVDLHCDTSYGKSIAMLFIASGVGNPAPKQGVFHEFFGTLVGLERLAASQSCLPLFLNDTKSMAENNPKLFSQVVYVLAEGSAKMRGNTEWLQETLKFDTIVITNGEAPLAGYCADGGARARILSLEGFPWKRADEVSREFVSHVEQTCLENFGHVMPRFLEFIMSHRDDWDAWKTRFREMQKQLDGKTGIQARFADKRAAITLAGQLLHESKILPWEFVDPFVLIWDDMQETIRDTDVGRRALRDLYAWCCGNQNQFFGRAGTAKRQLYPDDPEQIEYTPYAGFVGRWDDDDNWEFIGFIRPVLENTLAKIGYHDPGVVLTSWKTKGWLDNPDGKLTKTCKIGRESTRLICVTRRAINEATDGVLDDEELKISKDPTRNTFDMNSSRGQGHAGTKANVVSLASSGKRCDLSKYNDW